MKEHIKSNGISYTLQGDYYLPDLKMPEQPKVEIDIWGQRHLRYIKKYRPILYTNLLTSCKLTAYLADIDDQAQSMYERLMDKMAKREGVTEQLKGNRQIKHRIELHLVNVRKYNQKRSARL